MGTGAAMVVLWGVEEEEEVVGLWVDSGGVGVGVG